MGHAAVAPPRRCTTPGQALVAVAAMPKSTFPQPEWTTPTLRQSWIVENGLCSFPLVVGPDDLHCVSSGQAEHQVYVKAKKQAKWLYKCLKGHGANKGALQNSTVCELLLQKFKEKAQDGSEASGSQDKSTVVDVDPEGAAASTVVEASMLAKPRSSTVSEHRILAAFAHCALQRRCLPTASMCEWASVGEARGGAPVV